MNYKLERRLTSDKKKPFIYSVLDENGNVISQRRSAREYVAATINGSHYFGRLDLIGKGDHGKQVKWCHENGKEPTPLAYLETSPVEIIK